VDVAREFLRWFFEPAQYHEWILSGDNYNHPVWRDMENHAVWALDPKYKPLKGLAQHSHLYGWPAPPDERIQMITNSYIIPNMFAKVVTNAAAPLWKYGARPASPRRIGPLKRPTSCHLPVMSARPGSVTTLISPRFGEPCFVLRSVYTGMSPTGRPDLLWMPSPPAAIDTGG